MRLTIDNNDLISLFALKELASKGKFEFTADTHKELNNQIFKSLQTFITDFKNNLKAKNITLQVQLSNKLKHNFSDYCDRLCLITDKNGTLKAFSNIALDDDVKQVINLLWQDQLILTSQLSMVEQSIINRLSPQAKYGYLKHVNLTVNNSIDTLIINEVKNQNNLERVNSLLKNNKMVGVADEVIKYNEKNIQDHLPEHNNSEQILGK